MIPSRGLGRPFPFLLIRTKQSKEVPTLCRCFSSNIATAPRQSILRTHPLFRPSTPWLAPSIARSTLIPSPFVRFASSIPDPAPVTNVEPIAIPQDHLNTSLDSVTNSDLSSVTEHIGYLKDLGLDYGWGPTAFVETLLEHVHVWTGTPWWASIVLTAVLVRLVMFKAYVNASDTSARLAVITPLVKPIQARVTAARAAKDQQAMMAATAEIQGLYRSAGVQLWRLAVPMLQIPLGFGTFRLMRGMAELPVPGLDTQGLLWLQDLTLSDPLFILPIATAGAFHYTFKRGGELGSSATMSTAMQKTLVYVFPGMTGAFMLFWPGCMQLTFFTTAMLSLSQSWLMRQPWLRQYFGLQPLPSPSTNPPPRTPYTGTMNTYQPPAKTSPLPEKKGIIGGAISDIKGAAGQAVTSAKSALAIDQEATKTRGRSSGELRRAKLYEEKRRREIAQEQFDKSQKKRTRRA